MELQIFFAESRLIINSRFGFAADMRLVRNAITALVPAYQVTCKKESAITCISNSVYIPTKKSCLYLYKNY